jgi:hypothetical protein
MRKEKQNRYVVLDLGNRIPTDDLLSQDISLSLEVHRYQDDERPYSHYFVHRIIPCKFKQGKLYKVSVD